MQGKKCKAGGVLLFSIGWSENSVSFLSRDLEGGNKPCVHLNEECSL